jgi:hypothetical protein
MSNEIRTRHLIVTLPDTAAEEIDSIASDLEVALRIDWAKPNGTATHALGETLPDGVSVAAGRAVIAIEVASGAHDALFLSAHEARQLAGVLLAHAETISPAADLEA